MKATIELPDDLYRRVKARSALLGRSVREVTTELYQRWLGELPDAEQSSADSSWIDQWVSLGQQIPDPVDGADSARGELARDRGRLDPMSEA